MIQDLPYKKRGSQRDCGLDGCGGSNENIFPQAHIFKFLVPSWWNFLVRIRRYGLIGGGVTVLKEVC